MEADISQSLHQIEACTVGYCWSFEWVFIRNCEIKDEKYIEKIKWSKTFLRYWPLFGPQRQKYTKIIGYQVKHEIIEINSLVEV